MYVVEIVSCTDLHASYFQSALVVSDFTDMLRRLINCHIIIIIIIIIIKNCRSYSLYVNFQRIKFVKHLSCTYGFHGFLVSFYVSNSLQNTFSGVLEFSVT